VKERLVTLGLALAALAVFWALFLPKPAAPSSEVSRPLSTDARAAGYLGLVRWLAAEHVPAVAWRRRFDQLAAPRAVPSERGNVLITTVPHPAPVRPAEQQSLDAWLARGNTLIVMAALDDTPRWSGGAPEDFFDELKRLTRIEFTVIEETPASGGERARAAVREVLAPARVTLEPVAAHPLLAGVRVIATSSELPASRWRAQPMDVAPLLELARRSDTGEAALWLKAQGAGRVIISAYASPLSNAMLGEGDNGRWLSNVLGARLGPGGEVLIDDLHQGLGDEYDAAAFYRDARLHRTLGWLLALWLVFVVGARPLRAAVAASKRVDDTAFLTLSAGFFANALAPAVAGSRLLEHFFNSIRRRRGLREDGAPVWDWLGADARVTSGELARLKRLHARAGDGRRINLARLNQDLSQLARKLT
jgi:hypothetical protein